MWIRRLEVKDCAGVAEAGIALEPGLNVLYGPNELGKSTLVQAIRAALLLPAAASAAEPLCAWGVDALPEVAVTLEEAPGRLWRVRKRFGKSGGSAYLDFSRDGEDFSVDSRGREVDGALQRLLRWGVEPPGGRGRRRGMPASFITTALLGEQQAIDAILGASLKDDASDSGRGRLTDALQALSEHPLFKKVLASVQEKFAEAFSATGRRRIARGSPWADLRQKRADAHEREQEARRALDQCSAGEKSIVESEKEVLVAENAAQDAGRKLKNARAAEERRKAWKKAASARDDAQSALDAAIATVDRRDGAVAAESEAKRRVEELAVSLAKADAAVAEITPRADEALERVRELETGDAEAARKIREQEAEQRRMKAEAELKDFDAALARAQKCADLEVKITSAEGERRQCETKLAGLRERRGDAERMLESCRERMGELEIARCVARVVSAVETSGAREKELADTREHARRAKALAARAKEQRARAADMRAPEQVELDRLKKLDEERRVAEGKLAVGLAVAFTPERSGVVEVERDGDSGRREVRAGEPATFEARQGVRLTIAGVGVFEVRGGGPEAREDACSAAERWRTASVRHLKAAGEDSLAGLQRRRQRADSLMEEARESDRQAAEANLRSEDIEERERLVVVAEAEVEKARVALAGRLDPDANLDEFLRDYSGEDGEEVLSEEIDALAAETQRRESRVVSLRSDEGLEVERLAQSKRTLEDRQEDLRAEAKEVEDYRALLDRADKDRKKLQGSLDTAAAELQAVRKQATDAATKTRREAEDLSRRQRERAAERDRVVERLGKARQDFAERRGVATSRREAADGVDVAALRAVRDEAQRKLDALPRVEEPPEDLEVLAGQVERANSEANARRLELSRERGALEQLGGPHIREQAEQAQEALGALVRREHEVELEYGAWKLLRETLAEAEKEDAAHLGDAIVKPVSERLAALTGGRYEQVGIGPQLEATGVFLAGGERSFEEVSVGTREQAALLLRLAVAEALGFFLILDDNLTQSDSGRMSWLRDQLGKVTDVPQVIVMTCHPDAYLTGGEHAVDLTRCVTRHERLAPPAETGVAVPDD